MTRLARAVGALAAGLAIAWEHLTDRAPEPSPTRPTAPWMCPLCERPLTADSMHVHGIDAVWTTEIEGMVLFTNLAGGNCVEIYEEALRDG